MGIAFNSSVKQENSLCFPHDEVIHIDLKGEPCYRFLIHPSRNFQCTFKHISAYFIFFKNIDISGYIGWDQIIYLLLRHFSNYLIREILNIHKSR